MSAPTSGQFERPDANMRLTLTAVPAFSPPDPRASAPASPEGSPGVYRITFVLAVPGKQVFRSALDFTRIMTSGESLLLIDKGKFLKAMIFNDSQSVEIRFLPNTDGALAQAQVRLTVSGFAEAERLAYDLVLPNLSWFSFRYDVALDVAGYEVFEESTEARRWVFGYLGKSKALVLDPSDPAVASKPEYRALFAAYREALNATNVFYQFLSYYKVVEGVRKLRSKRQEAAAAAGKPCREASEQLPDNLANIAVHYLVKEEFRPYLGRKYNWVLDRFRDLVRNAIAHLNPEADSLVADKYEDVINCERALPVIKYLARDMLRRELAADPDTASVKVL